VKHLRRKCVGVVWIPRGPTALDRLQFLEARSEDFAQLLEVLQCPAQVAQFVHPIDLGEKSYALVAEFGALVQPLAQDAMPCRSGLVHAAARAAPRGRLAAAQQAFLLQALQRRIDLAELGGPEVVDALAEDGFQVVAAGWLAEQAKQDMVQTHAPNYITIYTNSNCYCSQAACALPAGSGGNLCRAVQVE
jgi:hypothetical protein